jgi:hypothetical protein
VEFRIQIETRIRRIAKAKEVPDDRAPLGRLIRALISMDVIDSPTGSGILELVALGNQAAHSVGVSSNAANWVLDVGPEILAQLDTILTIVEDTR